MEALIFFAVLVACVSGAFSSQIASSKGYSGGLWFFLGVFFPGFSLLAIGLRENILDEDEIQVIQGFKGKYYKLCPTCFGVFPMQLNECKTCIKDV